MSVERLYAELRSLVAAPYRISISDRDTIGRPKATVTLDHKNNSYHWTRFSDTTIPNALRRAIRHLKHPAANYVDERGEEWPASGGSIYGEAHIRTFLAQEETR
jgi:hypothetical protein